MGTRLEFMMEPARNLNSYISGIQLKWETYCSVSHSSSSLIFRWVLLTLHFNTVFKGVSLINSFANLILYLYFQYIYIYIDMFSHFCFSSLCFLLLHQVSNEILFIYLFINMLLQKCFGIPYVNHDPNSLDPLT